MRSMADQQLRRYPLLGQADIALSTAAGGASAHVGQGANPSQSAEVIDIRGN